MLSWILLAAVVFFSVSPIAYKPGSILSITLDQFLACALLTLVLTLAYPDRTGMIVAGIVTVPTIFEMIQIFEAGRYATFSDIVFKILGGFAGLLVGLAPHQVLAVLRRVQTSKTRHSRSAQTA